MHILFLTDNFPPETNAPASRTYEHCREWVRSGASVTVITANPNFPEGRLMPGHRNRFRSQREAIDGIEVIRVWSYISANQGFARRVLDYLSFAVMAFISGLRVPTDVIIATSPQFFTSWTGWALSKAKRRPWIFELRDLWPESIVAVGAMRRDRLFRILERIELALYRDATKVVAVTDAFKANLIARGIAANKIEVVTNGVVLSHFTPRPPDEALRDRLGVGGGKPVIGYIGTHGAAHGLGFILDRAAERPDHHFLFVGSGAEKVSLVAKAAAMRLANVHFHDPVPKDEVVDIIAACDVMLVPLRRDPLFETVIPSKIFEAAAMRRPILLGVEGEAQRIVTRYDAGVCFVPEDRNSFLWALHQISDGVVRGKLAKNCTALATAYDREILAARMIGIIRTIGSTS